MSYDLLRPFTRPIGTHTSDIANQWWRHSAVRPLGLQLRSVAAAALKASRSQLSGADRVRLCGHVKLSSLNSAGYLEFPDRTVEVRTSATSSA